MPKSIVECKSCEVTFKLDESQTKCPLCSKPLK